MRLEEFTGRDEQSEKAARLRMLLKEYEDVKRRFGLLGCPTVQAARYELARLEEVGRR